MRGYNIRASTPKQKGCIYLDPQHLDANILVGHCLLLYLRFLDIRVYIYIHIYIIYSYIYIMHVAISGKCHESKTMFIIYHNIHCFIHIISWLRSCILFIISCWQAIPLMTTEHVFCCVVVIEINNCLLSKTILIMRAKWSTAQYPGFCSYHHKSLAKYSASPYQSLESSETMERSSRYFS